MKILFNCHEMFAKSIHLNKNQVLIPYGLINTRKQNLIEQAQHSDLYSIFHHFFFINLFTYLYVEKMTFD